MPYFHMTSEKQETRYSVCSVRFTAIDTGFSIFTILPVGLDAKFATASKT
jgi:hypothetical protein